MIGPALSRQADDHVGPDGKSTPPASLNGVDERVVMVAPIHPVQGTVVHGLHAILHRYKDPLGHFSHEVEDFVWDTVGPRADGHGHDLWMSEGLLVDRTQPVDGRVCIGGGLEIGHELIAVRIANSQPADSLVDLTADVLTGDAAAGTEAAIVAKRASSRCDRAVYIRAGEPRVDADPLHSSSKGLLQEETIGKVPKPGGTPIIGFTPAVGRCGS